MRRGKLGDVYAFKTERGYRILHYVYYIEKWGQYIKIFPGFYNEQPQNLEEIISGDCAYMMSLAITKLYRTGLLEWWGTYPNDDKKNPFPTHDINYLDFGGYGEFEICESMCHQHHEDFKGLPDGTGIPDKYKDVRLINCIPDPISFLCILSSDFDLKHWQYYQVAHEKWNEYEKKYGDILFPNKK